MKILILNGSPRPNGITKKMINTFKITRSIQMSQARKTNIDL